MLKEKQKMSDLLTTVNRCILQCEMTEGDLGNLVEELNDAVVQIASMSTEAGSGEWHKKLAATRSYFSMLCCGGGNDLPEDADLLDHLVWSLLNDRALTPESAGQKTSSHGRISNHRPDVQPALRPARSSTSQPRK